MVKMVARESVLRKRVWEMVGTADLYVLTCKEVRRCLEREFGEDLRDRMESIRQMVWSSVKRRERLERKKAKQGKQGQGAENEAEGQRGDEQNRADEGVERAKKRKKAPGEDNFFKVFRLSPELEAITGQRVLRRNEVVKHLWAFIRENKLQDPNNRVMVSCSGNKLYDLFKVDSINFFHINKAVQDHLLPLEDGYESIDPRPSTKETKETKTRRSGFLTPYAISESLKSFLGTGEAKMSRAEAIERVWEYVLDNRLQDPKDKRRIRCDEKLKELFERESLVYSKMSKLLERHFLKPEVNSSYDYE